MSNSRERLSAQVSSWHPSTNEVTQAPFLSTVQAYGLTLRHTILGGTITNVTASAGTITYTCRNNFTAGDRVTITDVVPAAYNLTNVEVATASATAFTVTNAATGTYVSGGNVFTYFQIPTGITWVYALVVGGGGGKTSNAGGGGGGGVAWNWTPAVNVCVVGAGGAAVGASDASPGGYSRYGNVIAGGGAQTGSNSILGGGGGGSSTTGGSNAGTNYWGIPGGIGRSFSAKGGPGGGGAGGSNSGQDGVKSGDGGDGISGGGGGLYSVSGSNSFIPQTGGNGGSGLVGGGGGGCSSLGSPRNGGNGGNGIGIDGTIYTGGSGAGLAAGGGGAGIAGNGFNATLGEGGNGGLGGGGAGGGGSPASTFGGNGIIYIWY